MGMTGGGGGDSDTGDKLGGLRPWLRLFLGISGGAVAIACTLGLLVVLTTALAQAHEGSGGIREEEQDRIGNDPSWQPPSMHQGILPAKGSSEVSADATDAAGFVDAAPESNAVGEIDSELARDVTEPDEARGQPTSTGLQLLAGTLLLVLGFQLLLSRRGSRLLACGNFIHGAISSK